MSESARVTINDVRDLTRESYSWGVITWVCNGVLAPGAEQTIGVVRILPGKGNPLHYHPNCEEVLHVLAGECDHSFDGEWVHLHAGMTIRIPVGVRHNLVNRGREPVDCIICFSSPDRQTVFLEPMEG
jgi:quercetin dioxygenase-like cupin family protein